MTVIFFFSSLPFFFIIIIIIVLEDEGEEEALNILFHPYGHLCIYHAPPLGKEEEKKGDFYLPLKSGPCYFPLSLVCASYFWIYFERDVCVFILLKRKPEARQRAPYLWLAPNGPLAISSSHFGLQLPSPSLPIGQLGFWLPHSRTRVFLFPLDLFYSERVSCVFVWVSTMVKLQLVVPYHHFR